MTPIISEDEMQRRSKLITDKELLKLGKSLAEKELRDEYQDKMILEKENEINSLRDDLSSLTKKQIVLLFDNYTSMIKEKNKRCECKLKKINEQFDELNIENKENISEIVELENKTNKRILNLRNKCIKKNKDIKTLRIFSFFSVIISFLIGHLGIVEFFNNLFGIISRTILYLIWVFYLVYYFLNRIFTILINYKYYTCSISCIYLFYFLYRKYFLKCKIE